MKYNKLIYLVIVLVVVAVGVRTVFYNQSHHTSGKSKHDKPTVTANALCNALATETDNHLGSLSHYTVDGKSYQCRITAGNPPQNVTRLLYILEGKADPTQTREQLMSQFDAALLNAGWVHEPKTIATYTYGYTLSSNKNVHATFTVQNPASGIVRFESAIDDNYVPSTPNNTEPSDINPTNRVERLMP